MSFLLKDRIHQSLAETVYNEFLSRRSNYYYFIGKVLDWPNPLVPPSPEVTANYEYETRRQILQVKKVNVNDVSLVVRRINWSYGTIYDQFDGNYSTNFKSSTGASSLKDSNFYVLTSQFNVYKCLFNKNGAASTVEPTNFDPTPLTTADGYIWKYMYTVPLSVRNRFLTTDYMPVQRAVTNAYYSNGEITSIVIDTAGSGYLSNSTSISIIGDGTGAVLTPFVSDAGQIQDVIIVNTGYGYTHVNLSFASPTGSGANAYVNTSIGGIETIQSIVELSAVDGGIYAFRVSNVGSGYSYANVSLTGNGRDFAGNVVLSNNTVSYITVQNPGVGYTYANVSLIGDGGNANISAIVSPYGGHGKDSVSELFADAIMFTSTINNEKNQGLYVNNDYRQFGIIKDIRSFNSGRHYANVNGSACFLATMDSVTGLSRDSLLSVNSSGSVRHYQVVEVVSSTKQILVVDLNNHNLIAGDVLTDDNTAVAYIVISLDQLPEIDVFSGDLLYIDNRTSVSHSAQQLVTLRTIIKL
jgi:hypothetical protein